MHEPPHPSILQYWAPFGRKCAEKCCGPRSYPAVTLMLPCSYPAAIYPLPDFHFPQQLTSEIESLAARRGMYHSKV